MNTDELEVAKECLEEFEQRNMLHDEERWLIGKIGKDIKDFIDMIDVTYGRNWRK